MDLFPLPMLRSPHCGPISTGNRQKTKTGKVWSRAFHRQNNSMGMSAPIKKGKRAFCRHHTPPFNLEIIFPFHFVLQSSWNNLAKTGPYICWLSLARWSRYIWGHFLFPFYLVCRDLPDKIQYMGHRSNGFHPETKLSKFNFFFKLIFILTINGCRADAYMKMTKYFWKLIMVKIGRLTAAVGERPQRNSRQKRNFLHNLPRIQSLINPLGRKQRRTFSNIFSATYEQRQNKFPLKMVLMMLKHCMLYSILIIYLFKRL